LTNSERQREYKNKCELEGAIGLSVDIIHGPMRKEDVIEVGKVVELYAA
jgi:hypothetical protein